MRVGWLCAAMIAAVICSLSSEAAFAEKRMALVIGNSAYKNFAPVTTAAKDATDIGNILNLAGFEVIMALDLTGPVQKQTLQDFSDRAKDADLVALYFSGQAIETGGTNYMMPVDAPKASRQEAIDSAISVADFLNGVPKNAAAIVFFDAPRTDPFLKPGEKPAFELRDTGGPRFVHVAYATAPGQPLAPFDGANSAFATALLKHIKRPNLSLEQMDRAVRTETSDLTNRKQMPWSSSSGQQDIFFFLRLP